MPKNKKRFGLSSDHSQYKYKLNKPLNIIDNLATHYRNIQKLLLLFRNYEIFTKTITQSAFTFVGMDTLYITLTGEVPSGAKNFIFIFTILNKVLIVVYNFTILFLLIICGRTIERT